MRPQLPHGRAIHLITLGAGFDTRPLRIGVAEDLWRQQAKCDERLSWSEVDLPAVVEQKRQMLLRLTRRRPWLADVRLVNSKPFDLA